VDDDQAGVTGDGDPSASAPVVQAWVMPEQTGVRHVDESLATLVRLDELPTYEHAAVFDSAHRLLQDALADLDGA
jgi:hypothetical protein